MTLDDLEDETSSYIYEDKLKKKFVAAWKKLCEITSRSVSTGRPTERTIKFNGKPATGLFNYYKYFYLKILNFKVH